jgi:Cupin superfamily protein
MMDHRLVREIEKSFGWNGADGLGKRFVRGKIDVDLCARLLTPIRLLELIMRRSMSPYHLKCLSNGVDVNPDTYLAMTAERRGRTVPMVNMRQVGSLLQSGCTFVIPEVNTYDATMDIACRAMQWWCREVVQVNCYLTTGETSGFKLHWDDHDVIVVQLAGTKSWEVRGPSRPAPMYRDEGLNLDPPDETIWQGALYPGQVMHVPRGFWHQATRAEHGEGYSLHATFGMTKRTGVDWFTWLADQSRRKLLFREDLVRGDEIQQLESQLNLTDAAMKIFASERYSNYLSARERLRPAARHVRSRNIFGPPEKVVCVTEFPPKVEDQGERITVFAAGRTMEFSASAKPALDVLLSGHPVSTSALVTTAGRDASAVMTALLDEEICAEVTPELESAYASFVS